VRVNCTAGSSKPAIKLSWQVNGEPVEQQKLRKYDNIVSGREGLEKSVLGLYFRVEQHHFRNGDMKLKVSVKIYIFTCRTFLAQNNLKGSLEYGLGRFGNSIIYNIQIYSFLLFLRKHFSSYFSKAGFI